MGLLEKNRCKNLFSYVQKYDPADPKTYGGKRKNEIYLIFVRFGS